MLGLAVTLFSYVMARDYGFAPNPFGEFCTLGTCKPDIRRFAQIGDWVVGTGSATRQREGYLVYAMKVAEVMTFDEYWQDPRFQYKKPNLRGSKKQAFGDNIYRSIGPGQWSQIDSHHSLPDGTPNPANITRDTKANRILVATRFAYFGGAGPKIPDSLRNFRGYDLCKTGPGHKRDFPDDMIREFIGWFSSLNAAKYSGRPIDWDRTA